MNITVKLDKADITEAVTEWLIKHTDYKPEEGTSWSFVTVPPNKAGEEPGLFAWIWASEDPTS